MVEVDEKVGQTTGNINSPFLTWSMRSDEILPSAPTILV